MNSASGAAVVDAVVPRAACPDRVAPGVKRLRTEKVSFQDLNPVLEVLSRFSLSISPMAWAGDVTRKTDVAAVQGQGGRTRSR